jgi:excisionase family DNA binding protein
MAGVERERHALGEFVTYEQASELTGLPVGTLYALVHHKRIPHLRLSRRLVRFSRASLLAWLEAHRVDGQEPPEAA